MNPSLVIIEASMSCPNKIVISDAHFASEQKSFFEKRVFVLFWLLVDKIVEKF